MEAEIRLGLLTAEQLWENSACFEEFGRAARLSDLALITGCEVYEKAGERFGCYYTATAGGRWTVLAADENGDKCELYRKRHDGGVRPCFVSKELASDFDTDTVTLGEYPRSAADPVTAAQLDKALRNGALTATGRVFTLCGNTYREKKTDYRFVEKNELIFQKFATDELAGMMAEGRTFQSYGDRLMHGAEDTAVDFIPDPCPEYVSEGVRYVRVRSRPKEQSKDFVLSNGVMYHPGDEIWLKVEPVRWLLDRDMGLFVAEECLVSGIRLQKQVAVPDYDFAATEMGAYLTKYMARELFSEAKDEEKPETVRRNPHSFDFAEVSEEDIIRGCIEGGVPVFLHGASSEGKSARVRQIDPDCVVIYMRNATPDSLNGKSIVDAGSGQLKDIKPTWLKKLEAICEKEPEKLHILFFDELTNALPSIQGSAFNIVLDREVNGMWKLPENARIVAAGNELNDSLAAYQLAEPLFNRFAHVYIQTSLDAWLLWASENRLHPAIYAFIACREGAPLRSGYDGRLPNADPRKWEMASNLLYASGKPEMLRCLVGESITRDFCAFCKKPIITPADVLAGLKASDVKLSREEKRNSVLCLSQVDVDGLPLVREFVRGLGEGFCALFDAAWAHGDLSRLETVAALRRKEG